jgi:hypothetical protein
MGKRLKYPEMAMLAKEKSVQASGGSGVDHECRRLLAVAHGLSLLIEKERLLFYMIVGLIC